MLDKEAVVLPGRSLVFQCFTPVDGGMVHDHLRLWRHRLTKRINLGNPHACWDRLLKQIGYCLENAPRSEGIPPP